MNHYQHNFTRIQHPRQSRFQREVQLHRMLCALLDRALADNLTNDTCTRDAFVETLIDLIETEVTAAVRDTLRELSPE